MYTDKNLIKIVPKKLRNNRYEKLGNFKNKIYVKDLTFFQSNNDLSWISIACTL